MRTRITVIGLLIAIWLAFFAKLLFTQQQFGFRDTAHFYYPLFHWQQSELNASRLPLWNPYENLGTPSMAEASSCLFYPGKILFYLPFRFDLNFKLFVALHFLIASGFMYVLGRRWKCSPAAALLAAIAYTYGGFVLFQSSNVVYLISAAWLPCGMLALEATIRERSFRWGALFAVVMAFMVLCGDAQLAYNLGLIATLYAGLRWLRGCDEHSNPERPLTKWRTAFRYMTLLGFSGSLAFCLAAIQVLPSMQLGANSNRSSFRQPRSVYEAFSADNSDSTWDNIRAGIFGHPDAGLHHEQIYQFSIAPWQVAELLWPNASGKLFPANQRWTEVIPTRNRLWTTTLYGGILPMVLCLAFFRLRRLWSIRRGNIRRTWLQWLCVLAAIASLGRYGLGWLVAEIAYNGFGVHPSELPIGNPVGGLYWLLVVTLPTYSMFRYPAKLFLIVCFGVSILAGKNMDIAVRHPGLRRRAQAWLAGYLALTLLLLVGILATRSQWPTWFDQIQPNSILGPFDAVGSANTIAWGCLQTFLICSVTWLLLKNVQATGRSKVLATVVAFTAIDLLVANYGTLMSAPEIGTAVRPSSQSVPERYYRIGSRSWVPQHWREMGSERRMTELRDWERSTHGVKYPLLDQRASVDLNSSLRLCDYYVLKLVLQSHWHNKTGQRSLPREFLSAIGVQHIVQSDQSQTGRTNAEELVLNPANERAFMVHDVSKLDELRTSNFNAMVKRTQKIWLQNTGLLDVRKRAVIEVPAGFALPALVAPSAKSSTACKIVDYQALQVRVHVQSDAEGLLVLTDNYYPGWQASLHDAQGQHIRNLQIVRTNRVMRGVFVPAGEHFVKFHFVPTRFYLGAILSSFAWLTTFCLTGVMLVNKRRQTRPTTTRSGS